LKEREGNIPHFRLLMKGRKELSTSSDKNHLRKKRDVGPNLRQEKDILQILGESG